VEGLFGLFCRYLGPCFRRNSGRFDEIEVVLCLLPFLASLMHAHGSIHVRSIGLLWRYTTALFGLLWGSDAWCERCLLITESPTTPGHNSHLIWVLCYIPYVGLNGVQFCNCACSCVYCDSEFVKFVSSTLRSSSCFQPTISFLLRGRKGSLLWIDIVSFFVTNW